jgi:uncharacterized membrane protein
MIAWHTADAWTRAADRDTDVFRGVLALAGLAAPLFLWLAGIAVALSGARLIENGASREAAANAICRRGLELFVLAFLFRLQAFIVTPGSHPITIFRVDILNVMGPAIVLAGLTWLVASGRTAIVMLQGTLAAAIALVTPLVATTPFVAVLPQWVQWYLRPAGDLTTFTMFPWAGFVFAGAACGVLLAAAGSIREERRLQVVFACVGVALIAIGEYCASRPAIYRTSAFWTSSPTWFAIRLGILMLGVALLYAIAGIAASWNRGGHSLQRLGRSSLFVYWIHVELVYGYASWPLRGRLPIWGWLVACVVFSVLMYRAILLRDRVLESLRFRRRPRPTSQTATA